ncbi:polysaccharide biosynthesis C-terminal domain-containing protein [Adlercreutzia sp. ZJ242]|uniref:oligosaccharide flippase family protein n=1 Tax=Adlercreutzia sp. ZJ242 TaxID=2709409 RepID=UPI0013EAFED7|nr:polysaccharide biosynthesis C-terminal domain-containing protein [Adlercreutzia sp. ZJ242]
MRLERRYYVAIACKLLAVMVSFGVSVAVNRGLGVELKGEYAYIINIASVICLGMAFGLGQTYSTFLREKGEHVKFTFVALSCIHFGVGFVGCCFLWIFQVDPFFITILALSALAGLRANVSMIAVIENASKRNIVELVCDILYFVALCFLVYEDKLTVMSALACYAFNDGLRALALALSFRLKPSLKKLRFADLTKIYKSSAVTAIVLTLIAINYSIDVVMLGWLSTNYEVGLYSVAVTLANMLLLVPDALKEVLFGDSARGDSKRAVVNSIKMSWAVSAILIVLFVLFGQHAISILYGEEYSSSYGLTVILFLSCIPMAFFKIVQPIYISHGLQSRMGIFLLMSGIANIVLNIILIPIFNGWGAACASIASYSGCALLFFIDYKKRILNNRIEGGRDE